MAQTVAMAVVSTAVTSNLKLVTTSFELAITAANAALQALRPKEKNLGDNPLVQEDIESMDIEGKLRMVHALILTIQKKSI